MHEQQMKRKKAKLLVYGCQMNRSDAERMEGQLQKIGYEATEDMGEADLILINTCCVRETAEDRVYGKIGEIKHLKERNPKLIFGITGCMAQKEGEKLIRRAPHIDFVLGTNRVHDLTRIVEEIEAEHTPHVEVGAAETELPALNAPVARESKLTAWVPIMYGCNNFCTYCIVPHVRGRERSRSMEDILREVRGIVAQGCQEVTLLGQNVNSYGNGSEESFAELLRQVDRVEGIRRVRFMTSHPKDLSDEVIEAIRDGEHICEHIHLPVQYGSDAILKRMNRKYTVASYRALVRRIREAIPEVSLTTDLIVGFPGETEEDFSAMLDFLREMRYDSAYTFIYSKRSGTPAATMENQVEDSVKHERLARLMEVQNEISREINETLKDKTREILVEGPSKNDEAIWTGRTRTNKMVLFPHKGEQAGDFIQVRITQPQTWVLKGEQA